MEDKEPPLDYIRNPHTMPEKRLWDWDWDWNWILLCCALMLLCLMCFAIVIFSLAGGPMGPP